mgnify:CR=1 FL=1
MYNPRLGRFMQRDPLGTSIEPIAASRVSVAARNLSAPQFTVRDRPEPSLQYADGANLYQYDQGSPCIGTDPSGLIFGCSCDRTPTPARRSAGQCCNDALTSGLNTEGSTGGVICCDGQKISCGWFNYPTTPQGQYVMSLLMECTNVHERQHFGDVPDCPNTTALPGIQRRAEA